MTFYLVPLLSNIESIPFKAISLTFFIKVTSMLIPSLVYYWPTRRCSVNYPYLKFQLPFCKLRISLWINTNHVKQHASIIYQLALQMPAEFPPNIYQVSNVLPRVRQTRPQNILLWHWSASSSYLRQKCNTRHVDFKRAIELNYICLLTI